jgi:hypothetical protein
MTGPSARHIADEDLGARGSYLTLRSGDRAYDLYGWAAGRVGEVRIAATRDEFFDGVVIEFRGRRLFVDAPEIAAIHPGVVVLGLTVADLTRAARDPTVPATWPGGPRQVPPRDASGPADPDDAVELMASLSRMYVAGRLSVAELERDTERVLRADTCEELDAIAGELLAAPAA